jgi:hypothetical protein
MAETERRWPPLIQDQMNLQAQGRELEIDPRRLSTPNCAPLRASKPARVRGRKARLLKIKGTEIQQRLTELTPGSCRPLWRALSARHDKATTSSPIGPDYARGRAADLLQLAQDLDLRRLQRDPAQHHRQDGAGPLVQLNQYPTRTSGNRHGFRFTEEQNHAARLASRSSRRSNGYGFDKRRAIIKSETGWKRENWATFAELGLLAAPFTEELGGLGGGPIET